MGDGQPGTGWTDTADGSEKTEETSGEGPRPRRGGGEKTKVKKNVSVLERWRREKGGEGVTKSGWRGRGSLLK